ncbi:MULTISPECIES: TrmH family RNA methyltransferase [Olivibacter]|jgi:TrmH family RNA methyltransferase|uniref:TrmH family RNA methyltransferase n=1 Tax=Olivibacter oleidegradans TaxID=760123 RepID=A0ABV6HK55_9SPHI|nr:MULTISPECIES: RNA methyltransferase [Olivibacter]MDM8175042.1 RNA methyltransferase [Olivibacter sp. 47]QEL01825.1 RNA methyltransferase [Olivibacter sp. LS-1]
MLSKSQLQFVKSLHQKKFRKEHGLFIVEGFKSITDFFHSDYVIHSIYYTPKVGPKIDIFGEKIKHYPISERDLEAISTLKTPQGIVALIETPSEVAVQEDELRDQFSLVLDTIQDPGNLGTIIRTADWFGIKHIICSEETVECFNPKVVQATMGSLAHVSIHYTDLHAFLKDVTLPSFATVLDGQSIYETDFGSEGFIILGNEGNGIAPDLISNKTQRITIPSFGNAESLNVAVSAAICCSEISRKDNLHKS